MVTYIGGFPVSPDVDVREQLGQANAIEFAPLHEGFRHAVHVRTVLNKDLPRLVLAHPEPILDPVTDRDRQEYQWRFR